METSSQSDIVFQAIAHQTRREILMFLQSGPRRVTEIVERFSISQPAISQQLGVLLRASLVTAEATGRQRIYRLNPGPLRKVQDWVVRMVTDPSGHVWAFRSKKSF